MAYLVQQPQAPPAWFSKGLNVQVIRQNAFAGAMWGAKVKSIISTSKQKE